MKALAVRSNAKVNSRPASGGGDVKVSCSEKHCHISRRKKAQREGVCCEEQCEGKPKTNL